MYNVCIYICYMTFQIFYVLAKKITINTLH